MMTRQWRSLSLHSALIGGTAVALFAGPLLLVGCGGSGGKSAVSGGQSGLNLYVTDGFSDQYSHVQVTLFSVEVSNDNGKTWTPVYNSASGETIDLRSLASTAQLLGSVSIAAIDVTNARLTFDGNVTLVTSGVDGTASNVSLDVTAPNISVANGKAVVTLSTPTAMKAGHLSNLVLDFRLAAFSLVHGALRPSIVTGAANEFQAKEKIARISGTIAALAGTTALTLDLPRLYDGVQPTVAVSLTASTLTSGALATGQTVVIEGDVDSATGSVTARNIEIVPKAFGPPDASPTPPSTVPSSPAPSAEPGSPGEAGGPPYQTMPVDPPPQPVPGPSPSPIGL